VTRAGVLIVVAGLQAGCATVYRRYDFERTLASNAAYDMNCPKAQLAITAVGDDLVDGTDLPMLERVEGCRQRADYRVSSIGYKPVVPSYRDTSPKGFPMCGAGYRDYLDSKHFH
jgi:hypothetical protein